MEKITQKQWRLIRRGFCNDNIFVGNNCCGYLKEPVMGKTLQDIKFKKGKHEILEGEKVITKGKTFVLYNVHFVHSSQTMYVITVDDKIYYYTFSSIFAPASSAFHTLTEVYWDGHTKEMSWRWAGLNQAKCFYAPMFEGKPIAYKRVKDVTEHINGLYYHY